MQFDALYYPYSSRRGLVFAKRGMVATSQPLAAQAGLDMLKKGGNAIDAAIAAAACLTVVEPTSNGIGGDAFAIVWINGKIHGLNASGPAPKLISAEKLRQNGYKEMPPYGWIPVTVPGIPAAWAELSRRFGKLSFTEVLKPAIEYANDGFPVTPIISQLWQTAYHQYAALKEDIFQHWFKTFAPAGHPPQAGELWRAPDHAKTLEIIALTQSEDFYRGNLAEKIDAFSRATGGYLRSNDLAEFHAQWVEPIKVDYHGYDIWEIPPNGQGLVALMAFNILKGLTFNAKDAPDTYHEQIEAIKLAFADGQKYITDPNAMRIPVKELLSATYAEERRKLIGPSAINPSAGVPDCSNTVYLAAADGDGNMVSYIQSNYKGFGSGLVVPGTGISLQNRGANFSLDAAHDNCLCPGKKTYHTIIPGFLTKNGQAIGPFGVMGGFVQPQGHVQVMTNIINFGLNPQAALDAPRWQWIEGKAIEIEPQFPQHIAEALARRGHIIRRSRDSIAMGRGQIIWRNDNGILCGATEPRADGTVAAW